MRDLITSALKTAMKEKDTARLSTLRLVNAAIKDRDIDARAEGREEGVEDSEILAILGKMAKQRAESARAYEEGGRLDLAERELQEMGCALLVCAKREFVGEALFEPAATPPRFKIFAVVYHIQCQWRVRVDQFDPREIGQIGVEAVFVQGERGYKSLLFGP